MGERHQLPDVGEGVAEAELVEWHVKVGDLVRGDALLAAVMTDKATSNSVAGRWRGAVARRRVGQTLRSGSPIRLRWQVRAPRRPAKEPAGRRRGTQSCRPALNHAEALLRASKTPPSGSRAGDRRGEAKPLASPSVRLRAGGRDRPDARSGPGRQPHQMSTIPGAWAAGSGAPVPKRHGRASRSLVAPGIAEKMALAVAHPHIPYVEEVDVTALEVRRASKEKARRPAEADAVAVPDSGHGQGDRRPAGLNALFDDEAGVVTARRRAYRHCRSDAGGLSCQWSPPGARPLGLRR
jgi:2-oxoisovalerate dehydrogenase E2 component (dihydrolipoyl transacylase)